MGRILNNLKISNMQPDNTDELEALKPRSRKRKRKRPRKKKTPNLILLIIERVENYLINCVEWEKEVKPVVNMIEAVFARDGPPELWKAVKRIKKHFDEKIYGVKIIKEGDIIHGDKNEVNRGGKIEKVYSDDNSEIFKLLKILSEKEIWQRLTE